MGLDDLLYYINNEIDYSVKVFPSGRCDVMGPIKDEQKCIREITNVGWNKLYDLINRYRQEEQPMKMPELKPGMLVSLKSDRKSLYKIIKFDYLCEEIDLQSFQTNGYCGEIHHNEIADIYEQTVNTYDCWNGYDSISVRYDKIWSCPEPKEMTVIEISEELGYPVKIVKED